MLGKHVKVDTILAIEEGIETRALHLLGERANAYLQMKARFQLHSNNFV